MAQSVEITITEEVVEVDVTIAPEELAKIEAANAQASATAAATSESNAATSESNAQTSANNASTSEGNAADDASDAEKHAQETAPFTDSDGVAFNNGAQGFKNQAEAARDEITGKFTFADYSDGDLARFDGTKFQPITAVEILQDKDVFAKSYVGLSNNFTQNYDIKIWDNLISKGNGALTTTYSGDTYTDLVGDGFVNTNGYGAQVNTDDNITGFEIDGGATLFDVFSEIRFGIAEKLFHVYYKDANNYIKVGVDRFKFYVNIVDAGVETLIYDSAFSSSNGQLGLQKYLLRSKIINRAFGNFYLHIQIPMHTDLIAIELNSYQSTFGVLDISHVGFSMDSVGSTRPYLRHFEINASK